MIGKSCVGRYDKQSIRDLLSGELNVNYPSNLLNSEVIDGAQAAATMVTLKMQCKPLETRAREIPATR